MFFSLIAAVGKVVGNVIEELDGVLVDVAPVIVPGTAPCGAGRSGVNRQLVLWEVSAALAEASVTLPLPVASSVFRVMPPLLAD